jgi:hypothetical protein
MLFLIVSTLIVSILFIKLFLWKRDPRFGYVAPLNIWRNWDHSHSAVAVDVYHAPKTLEEICSIIKNATEAGERVKCVGGSHSWSDIAKPHVTAVVDGEGDGKRRRKQQPTTSSNTKWHLLSL